MSTYAFFPTGRDPNSAHQEHLQQPRNLHPQAPQNQAHQGHLSPQPASSSASPAVNTHTPAESESTLSIHYQSSEFSEVDDAFFGLNFDSPDGASPSFFDNDLSHFDLVPFPEPEPEVPPIDTQHAPSAAPYLPLSPEKSHNGETGDDAGTHSTFPTLPQSSVSPRDLSLASSPSPAAASKPTSLQLTPVTNDSAESSDSGFDPTATMQSPRVTVSHWDQDYGGGHSPKAGETLEPEGSAFFAARDDSGRWIPDQGTGQAGLDPSARPTAQVDSINDLATQRQLSERNQEVDEWLQRANEGHITTQPPDDGDDNITLREIPLGHKTENKAVAGQTYYTETGGELTQEDVDLMRQGRNWEDAPLPFSIYQPDSKHYQPQTSQAAIEKYQRMCQDNDSIMSRAATWGTRRFSLPGSYDAEVQVTGNLFKKLSLSREHTRRPSLLDGLRGLVRKPSVNSGKRARPVADDAKSFQSTSSAERKESQAKLAPPSPKPGWSRKQSVPSINTAFVDVGSRVASVGTMHARAGSVSATSITSPRSPSGLSLSVKKPLNRLRSKSDTSGIVDLWKKSGGPPVSNLGNTKVEAPDADDDEEDDDDGFDDGDMKGESPGLIDDITPNFAGFQQHIMKLNPFLAGQPERAYLVDRIAHQQLIRYKYLLNLRVKHLQAIGTKNCSAGSMCIAQGGQANILDTRGDSRGLDPLSRYDDEDGDITPLEGAINPDSFPQDIPMPLTASLPAEFECQLCFNSKKFQKPSDWTKHVHEDVQPFTCTWDRCKEPKMFKRKADWVRHENEGHRHLEWWICDFEDCRHKCYRRDNFLQHLVREHKFIEPKVKTKAAIKRAGATDPTWAKVEQCHHQTTALPVNEPCRFCGKAFPSWKKLTVHLAKHMEQISLPVLKLVAKKDLDEDTIISPVQEPPPADLPNLPNQARAAALRYTYHDAPDPTAPADGLPKPTPALPLGMFPLATPGPYPTPLFTTPYNDLALAQAQLAMPSINHHHHHPHHNTFQSLASQAAFPIPTTTTAPSGTYIPAPQTSPYHSPQSTTTPYNTSPPTNPYSNPPAAAGYMSMAPDIEPFPALSMVAMGLQDPSPVVGGVREGWGSVAVSAGHGGFELEGHQQHGQQQQGQFQGQGQQLGQQLGQQQGQQGQGQQGRLSPQQQQQMVSPQFTPQGSPSPFGRSPNLNQGVFISEGMGSC